MCFPPLNLLPHPWMCYPTPLWLVIPSQRLPSHGSCHPPLTCYSPPPQRPLGSISSFLFRPAKDTTDLAINALDPQPVSSPDVTFSARTEKVKQNKQLSTPFYSCEFCMQSMQWYNEISSVARCGIWKLSTIFLLSTKKSFTCLITKLDSGGTSKSTYSLGTWTQQQVITTTSRDCLLRLSAETSCIQFQSVSEAHVLDCMPRMYLVGMLMQKDSHLSNINIAMAT